MFWDVALPVLAAIAQVLTGFLGWRVTVDGVRPDRKKLYEWLFAMASLIGIAAVGVAAYRGSQITHDLSDLKKGQQTTNAGIQHIENTPPSVTVNPQITLPTPPAPKEHTRADFVQPFPDPKYPLLPYHKGQEVFVNIGFRNAGEFTLQPANLHALVTILPTDEMMTAFRRKYNELKKTPKMLSGALNPHLDSVSYRTFSGPTLTDSDISALNNGTEVLCAVAYVDWGDATGRYRTEFAECFAAELPIPTGGFNWHILPENNTEHKLD